mmetsp:Transcript_84910/g.150372  ORF Transcript_84910/g.150372 Transcript_84910/m.150372 type:complete len:291 (-) Transcript_84910:139-1011(-)
MSARQLPLLVLEHIAEHLPFPNLLRFGTLTKSTHEIATRLGNLIAALAYNGIHPSSMSNSKPHWMQLRTATVPRLLIAGRSEDWPELTRAFPFTLDTRGPLFLEFRMVIARAPNGSPRIGVLDAVSSSKVIPESSHDWSRGRGDKVFSISMSPSGGEVLATMVEGGSQKIEGLPTATNSRRSPRQNVYKATLNWPVETKEQAKWNPPIQGGLFLKDGALSFWRMFENGSWHSSGIICEDLPERVLPCVFMLDFMGYTHIAFESIKNKHPPICPHCDWRYHGTVDGWRCFP